MGNPSFREAVTAVSSIIFAFSGTPAFFSIVAEMRDPTQYNKSLLLCQSVVTTVYTIIGCVVYYYCGVYVASPALGSAGGTIKKIAYGFAIPGLIATTVITVHVSYSPETPSPIYILTFFQGPSQIPPSPPPPWLQTPNSQLKNPLDHLALLHNRLRSNSLHNRQCNSRLRRSSLSNRCSPRNTHVFPTHGRHVAI